MAKVKFNRQKTKEQALQGNSGTIYFTTDDHSVVLDGKLYGGEQEVTLKDTPAGVVDDVEYVSKGDIDAMLLTATKGLALETTAQAAKSSADAAKNAVEALPTKTEIAEKVVEKLPTDLARQHEYDERLAEINSAAKAWSEGKPALAAAITSKGVQTAENDSYTTMAENVLLIPQVITTFTADDFSETIVPGEFGYDVIKFGLTHRLNDYQLLLSAEFYKGNYDTIELTGADAYYTSDGHFYDHNDVHTWDEDNHINRIVVYYFRKAGSSFIIPSTNLCPIKILVDGICGNIVCENNGRLLAIYKSIGSSINDIQFASTNPWQENTFIDIKEHSGSYIINNSPSAVNVFIKMDAITNTGKIITGVNPLMETLFVDVPTINTSEFYYIGQPNYAPKLTSISLPNTTEILYCNFLHSNDKSSGFKSLTKIDMPNLIRWIGNGATSGNYNYAIYGGGPGGNFNALRVLRFPKLKEWHGFYIGFMNISGLEEIYFDSIERLDNSNRFCNFAVNNKLHYIYVGYSDNDRTKSVYIGNYQCPIDDVELKDGYLKNINVSTCTSLTHDNIMENIINRLGVNQDWLDNPIAANKLTLTIGSTNLNKLTSEEKQIAIDKGWTLA